MRFWDGENETRADDEGNWGKGRSFKIGKGNGIVHIKSMWPRKPNLQALKGRHISARVVRPGYTKCVIFPACKVGTSSV